MQVPQYAQNFKNEGYDDLNLLCHLTRKGSFKDFQLQEINIFKLGHRMRILAALEFKADLHIETGRLTAATCIDPKLPLCWVP